MKASATSALKSSIAHTSFHHKGKNNTDYTSHLGLLNVADLHAQIFSRRTLQGEVRGGLARIRTASKIVRGMLRKDNPELPILFFGTGDNQSLDDIFAYYTMGFPHVVFLNELGLDCDILGNHHPPLLALQRHAQWCAKYSTVTSNLYQKGSPSPPPGIERFGLFQKQGVSVGVIGLAPTDGTFNDPSMQHLLLKSYKQAIEELLPLFRDYGVDYIVIGLHGGRKTAEFITNLFPKERFIFLGGHTHEEVSPCYIGEFGQSIFVQTGVLGSTLGYIMVAKSQTDDFIHLRKGGLIPITSEISPDPDLERLIGKFYAPYKREFQRVLGRSNVHLPRNLFGPSPAHYLYTDIMLQQGREMTDVPIDAAVLLYGQVRNEIPRRKITVEESFTRVPYGDQMLVVAYPAIKLQQALNRSASCFNGDQDHLQPLFASGIRAEVRQPKKEWKVDRASINGKPFIRKGTLEVSDDTTYNLLLNDYHLRKGSQQEHPELSEGTIVARLGLTQRQMFEAEMADIKVIRKAPDESERILYYK